VLEVFFFLRVGLLRTIGVEYIFGSVFLICFLTLLDLAVLEASMSNRMLCKESTLFSNTWTLFSQADVSGASEQDIKASNIVKYGRR